MHRTISDYKITKRKDGRNYVRLQDGGDITHIYGKTKSEVQAMLDRRQAEQVFPTRNITLANWAHLCLNTFCASSISGNIYSSILLKTGIQCGTIYKSCWLFFSIKNGV